MIATPDIRQTPAQATACIHLQVSLKEMMSSFGAAVEELVSTLTQQGTPPAGAAFAHHFSIPPCEGPPQSFDFEVGFIVDQPVVSAGRVYAGQWPSQRMAHTTYSGPYEGLPDAWAAFSAWMDAEGLVQAGDLWEHYVVGPQTSSDSTQWRTELYRPLR